MDRRPKPARRGRPSYAPNDVVGGKYVVRELLGEGEMGVVYAAVDRTCDRPVALRILRPGVTTRRAPSEDHVQRVAASLARLQERTSHVVEVLSAGITEDRELSPYCVTERVRGITLRGHLEDRQVRGQRFEIVEIAGTVGEIATALACAHDMGIVHGDVKPETVIMAEQRDGSSHLKVLDFGIRELAGEDEEERRAFPGSGAYAAPEQREGQPPSPASDVHALGLVLYEMITFALPYDPQSASPGHVQTPPGVARRPLELLSHGRRDVPTTLQELAFQCLDRDPSKRPSALHAATTLCAVRRALEAEPPPASASGAPR